MFENAKWIKSSIAIDTACFAFKREFSVDKKIEKATLFQKIRGYTSHISKSSKKSALRQHSGFFMIALK